MPSFFTCDEDLGLQVARSFVAATVHAAVVARVSSSFATVAASYVVLGVVAGVGRWFYLGLLFGAAAAGVFLVPLGWWCNGTGSFHPPAISHPTTTTTKAVAASYVGRWVLSGVAAFVYYSCRASEGGVVPAAIVLLAGTLHAGVEQQQQQQHPTGGGGREAGAGAGCRYPPPPTTGGGNAGPLGPAEEWSLARVRGVAVVAACVLVVDAAAGWGCK